MLLIILYDKILFHPFISLMSWSISCSVMSAVSEKRMREVPSGNHFEIHDCEQGEYALIFALMHPEVEVDAYDRDEDNVMLASNISCLPANLHFHLEL